MPVLIFQIKFDNRIFNQINEKILHVIKQSVEAYKSPLVGRNNCLGAIFSIYAPNGLSGINLMTSSNLISFFIDFEVNDY